MTPEDLVGRLFPAVPVPMDAEGRWHEAGQRDYIQYMARQPIGGVAVWAHTGRGLRLSEGLRADVLRSWREAFGPDRFVIAAAGARPDAERPEQVVRQAAEMAEQAVELGADALLVHPPTAFRGRPDEDDWVYQYHSAVAEAGRPLILFLLYEAAGGILYGPEVLAQLLGRPEVLGIKVATLDSVMTFQEISAMVQNQAPDKVVVTGEDRFLGYSLMTGARSALIGMGAACTRLQAELLRSHLQGDAGRFLAINPLVDDLGRHTFRPPMEGYILRMLWCLVHQGLLPAEAAHDPWGPTIPPEEFKEIGDCLRRIGQFDPEADPLVIPS
ncbi:hypothetical protein BH23PLA1_BH23PLA1_03040 [soil metagenome]